MDVYNRKKIDASNCNELMQVTAKSSQLIDNNVLKNDVFLTPTSETADDIGRVMVIEENLPNTVYSYHLMRYRPFINSFYSIFPNYSFSTLAIRKQMRLAAQGVQRFVINKSALENIIITKPNYNEQEQIGTFFTQLDNLITLHQRKLKISKKCKKKFF